MPDRLLVLLLLAALLVLAVSAARYVARQRASSLATKPAEVLLAALGVVPDGRATVAAFSTRSCAACHTAQKPALRQLERALGERTIRVVEVDATEQVEVAQQFGVLTVPTTVVLTASGQVAAVNHGFAPVQRLEAQVRAAA